MYALALILIVAVVLLWNFNADFREKLRGYSTVLEGAVGIFVYYFDIMKNAFDESGVVTLLPDNWQIYIPVALFVWLFAKRWQTTTPIGKKY